MKHTYHVILTLLFLGLLHWSCSTTKRLASDEILYAGVKNFEVNTEQDEDSVPKRFINAAKEPLMVKPNNPLWSPYIRTPLPIGLWAWNYLYTEKQTGLKHWLYERLAKEPILISTVQPEVRLKVTEEILANYGYFGATTAYELYPRKRNEQIAKIGYTINVPRPWFLDSVRYLSLDGELGRVVDTLQQKTLIHSGSQYNIDTLTQERSRISDSLRERGYYYFQPDFIEYLADTTREEYHVDLRMKLHEGIPEDALQPYRVGQINVWLQNPTASEYDTLTLRPKVFVEFQKPIKIRPKVLNRAITIEAGELYRLSAQNKTQTNLNRLGIFRYVNLYVTPLDSLRGRDSLDVYIDAAFDVPLSAELEVDLVSKSNSFLGPGLNFRFRNKNFLHGGEIFTVRLNGSYEWQTGNKRQSQNNASLINSYELGLNIGLSMPRLAPRFLKGKRGYPSTSDFQLGADLLNRPRYFTMLSFNASAGYSFQTSPYSFHSITPAKLVYNHLIRTTPEFDRTMELNPALALSFQNQLIPSMNYTYTYDRTLGGRAANRLLWQTSFTQAGNLLYGIADLANNKQPKKVFGNRFSQFVKATTEARQYHKIGTKNMFVSRILVGAGYAYGNARVLPYSEQFYIGGANSIRAFTIRTIGPGSYRPADVADVNSYLDQTGEFKLEANLEFRFNIAGKLNGAVFLDAGNIWLLRDDPDRPGGQLKARGFWREIGLGTGAGLRYDISYLVIRADLGVALHTPYPNPDKPGYYNISKFGDGLGFHIAIGYPF